MRIAKSSLLFFALTAFANAQQYRAYWADAFHYGYKSVSEVEQLIQDAERSHANAIFIQARRRADSYYINTLEVPAQDATYTATFDALEYLIERAHSRGIEVHAWFVVYPVWPVTIAPPVNPNHVWHKHGPRAAGRDMWMSVSSAGGVGSAFDPGHPDAQRYLASVITDAIRHYAIDGIHLDYIRYNEDADYGWNPVAVERYQRLTNMIDFPRPREAAWNDFRRVQVTGLVRQIYLRAIEERPSIKVSAALISWGNGPLDDAGFRLTDAYGRVFQDWRSWVEEGILDLAMPMHYFREATNASFLDRWLEFSKDRQFRRAYVPGLAPYLNSIPDSMSQIRRALAPSAAGNSPLGVSFYSYASTNLLNAAGAPVTPNAEFYARAGELFGAPAAIPDLPWKSRPALGHVAGRLEVDAADSWLNDGVTAVVSSDTGGELIRTATTDGTGFFGFVDLPPDRYRLRLERGGKLIWTSTPRDVTAGRVTRFDVNLRGEDLASVLPVITSTGRDLYAAADMIVIRGRNLAPAYRQADQVPLPALLSGVRVVTSDGLALPLLSVSAEEIIAQLPVRLRERETFWVRHSGMDSQQISVRVVESLPVILTVRRIGDFLEIYATGLGLTTPPLAPGEAADPTLSLPVISRPVFVLFGERMEEPLYAGAMPYQPGRYQVNIRLPDGVTSRELRISVGGVVSNAVRF
jgi:uncharacterized protein (TIGR03437 family)